MYSFFILQFCWILKNTNWFSNIFKVFYIEFGNKVNIFFLSKLFAFDLFFLPTCSETSRNWIQVVKMGILAFFLSLKKNFQLFTFNMMLLMGFSCTKVLSKAYGNWKLSIFMMHRNFWNACLIFHTWQFSWTFNSSYGFYYFEVISFCSSFAKFFSYDRVSHFVKRLFCINWDDHRTFSPHFAKLL